jgi:hypothetical protein
MAQYASRILKRTVDKLLERAVVEVRFVSGLNPAFVDKHGVHFLDFGPLSHERVGEIHELCRLVADDPVEETESASTYSFVLRHIGRVVCTFQNRGDASSLVVTRDSDAVELVDAIRPRRPLVLRAAARPESKSS